MNKKLIWFGTICMVIGIGIQLLLAATAHAQPATNQTTFNQQLQLARDKVLQQSSSNNTSPTDTLLKQILNESKIANIFRQDNMQLEIQKLNSIDIHLQKLIDIINHPPPPPPFGLPQNATPCKPAVINGSSVMVCQFPPVPQLPLTPPSNSNCSPGGFC